MMKQGSEAWHAARGGMLTASMIYRVMSGTTGLDRVRDEIRLWRKTGEAPPGFTSAATEWGKEHEGAARASAEIETGIPFKQTGMIVHPEYAYVGASPDGVNHERRCGLETKCPHNPDNHERYLDARSIPTMYRWQMQCGMWVTGYESWLFVSFDPRRLAAGDEHHTILHWIPRNESLMRQLEERVTWFWSTI